MKFRVSLPTSLSLSASLALAFAVFLAPVIMLLAMFLREQQRDIDFATKEIRGVQMAMEVKKAGLSIDNAVYSSKTSGALSSSLFTVATDLRRAEKRYGIGFGTSDTVNQVAEKMVAAAAAGSLSNAQAGPILAKIRSLSAQIGDASSLILDPELESYYLMDMLMVRLPEVSNVISTRAEALELFDGANVIVRQRDNAEVLVTNGTYRFASRQLKDAAASAFRHTGQPGKMSALQVQFADTIVTLERLDGYLKRSIETVDSYDAKVAATMEWQARQRIHEVSIVVAEQLKSLLEQRIERLEMARFHSLLGAVTLFLAAMAFVAILLSKRVTEPVKSLTQAADRFVAGDLSEVTPLQSRTDEIGALARAFERLRIDANGRLIAEAERASAVAANQAKSSFLAVMSHELRTPLNAVIGYAEILEEDLKAENMQQQLDDAGKIRGAGRHLLGVINQVLDLSKIEAGSMETESIEYCPSSLVRDVIATTRHMVDAGGNTLGVSANDLPMVIGDPTKVRQCLFNLISNAAKFTQNGIISVEALVVDDKLTIKVKDTGIGMTKGQMAKIFEPFVQADESTTRKFGGTGLGLAITRKLARLMDGEAIVTSKLGLGSTFTLTIGLKVAEPVGATQNHAPQIAQAA